MLRPGLAVVATLALAFAVPASAGQLAPRMGMTTPTGASLAMLDSKVTVSVHGAIAEATVTQTFRNDSDRVVEATYIFPLPEDAAVSAMAIDYGSRKVHAEIVKRDEAKRRYEDAVTAGVAGAMLEQERPDIFTQTVTAIPAHGEVAVTLRYDTVARFAGGTWQLALPMVVAPRYVPGAASGRATTGTGGSPDTDRAPDASRVTPNAAPGAGGRTEVALAFDGGVEAVESPSHELEKRGDGYAFTDAHSDHDAIIRWRAKAPANGWVEQDDDGGYAAVLVEAPLPPPRKAPMRALIVVDRSATTHGDAESVAHPLVRALLGALDRRDSAAVAGGVVVDWRAPDDAARATEAAWTNAAGALDLTRTLAATHPRGAAVVLVTDGLVADDAAVIAAARGVGAPVHVIGVGQTPNRSLLAAIASATNGTVRYAIPGDDLAALAKATLADAASLPPPLQVSWGTLAARDVVPAQLPRLAGGQAVLVLARVDRAHAANARAAGDVFAFGSISTSRPPEGAITPKGPLARRWARARLDELVAAGNRAAIAAHALRYGLVTTATAMIAIGDEVIVQGGVKHTVAVPVSVPAGMHWQTVKQEVAVALSGKDGKADDLRQVQDKEQASRPVVAANKKQPAPAHAPGGGRPAVREPVHPAAPAVRTPIAAGPASGAAPTPAPMATTTGEPVAKAPAPMERPEPDQAPRKAPARDDDGASDAKKSAEDDAGGRGDDEEADDDARPARKSKHATRADAPVAGAASAGEYETADEVMVAGVESPRRFQLRLGFGAGAYRQAGSTEPLIAPRLSLELGRRHHLGVEGSLWFVDHFDLEATVLGTLTRIGVFPHFDLVGGLGLHLGDGAGPAAAVELRLRYPHSHFSNYLRYDGALLFHDHTRDGQNAGTFGVEATF